MPDVEIVLQDDGRCDLVQSLLSRTPVLLGHRQSTLGLMTGEPFILQGDRQPGQPAQLRCEIAHTRGHAVGRAIKTPRQSDHDSRHGVRLGVSLRHQAIDFGRGEPRPIASQIRRTQATDRSREGTAGVANRDADSPLSYVKAHDPHAIILSFFFNMTARTLSVVMMVALSAGLAGQTSDRNRAEAEARRVDDRIRTLQNEADGLVGQSRTLLGELRTLEIERQIQIERVREAETAIAESEAAIAQTTADLAQLETQREAQIPDLQTQLVDIYKRGRAGYARLLLGSEGLRELGRATRTISALMRLNRERITAHRETLDALRLERERLDAEIPALRTNQAAARQAQAAAARALAARTALLAQIDTERDLNAQLAGELQVAYERLRQQAASLESNGSSQTVTVPLAPFRGDLDWPVPGRIAATFGQTSARLNDSSISNGVEIAALEGTPVRAIHPGTVSFADAFTGFGNLVIIDHGANAYSLYGYLEAVSVGRGDTVESGSEIARVGAPPAGPSVLYLEIRVDGRSVDPVEWLKPR